MALAWIADDRNPEGFVLSLSLSSPLVLWSVADGSPVWTVSVSDVLSGFSLDPFNASRLGVVTADSLIVVDDFSTVKVISYLL